MRRLEALERIRAAVRPGVGARCGAGFAGDHTDLGERTADLAGTARLRVILARGLGRGQAGLGIWAAILGGFADPTRGCWVDSADLLDVQVEGPCGALCPDLKLRDVAEILRGGWVPLGGLPCGAGPFVGEIREGQEHRLNIGRCGNCKVAFESAELSVEGVSHESGLEALVRYPGLVLDFEVGVV